MNTFFQKQGVTQVNLVFDKQEKTNSFLLSASDRERNIEVVNGDVYVNKARQKTVRIDDTLYWEDSEGRQWAIKGKHPMKPYRGVVNQNGSVQRFTALPTTSYLLYYTTKDESGQPQKIQFRLEYGLTTSDEGFITFFRFWYLNDGVEELAATNLSSDKDVNDDYQAVYCEDGMTMCVDASGNLNFQANLSATIPIIQSLEPERFPGFAIRYDLNTLPGFDEITGTASYDNNPDGEKMEVRTERKVYAAVRPLNLEETAALRNNFLKSEMALILQNDEIPMSVTDLFSLTPPQADEINNDFGKLFTNILMYFSFEKNYHYEPKNMDIAYGQWLGVTKESLFSGIKGTLGLNDDQTEKFLAELKGIDKAVMAFVDDFTKASISNSFASSGLGSVLDAFEIGKLPEGMDKKEKVINYKCNYYFNGYYQKNEQEKDQGLDSLQSNPIAEKLQSRVMNELYLSRVEGLRRYVESEEKESWGNKLFEHCIKNKANIAMQVYSPGGTRSYLKHLCTMLDLLDDSLQIPVEHKPQNKAEGKDDKEEKLSYSGALYTYILNLMMTELGDSLVISDDNIQVCRDYLKQFFHSMADFYFNKSEELAPDVVTAIKGIVDEYNIKTAEELATLSDAHLDELIALLTKQLSKNPVSTGLAKNPFAKSFFGELGAFAVYGLVFYMLVPIFKDWKKATPAEKTLAVSASLRVVVGIGCDAIRLKAIKTLSNPNSSLLEKVNAAQRLKFGGDDFRTISDIYASGNGETNAGFIDNIKDTARYKIKSDIKADINMTTKVFGVADVFIRGLNIVFMGLAAYEMGRKIKQDFENGEGADIITLDILQESCLVIGGLCELISIGSGILGKACEFIPYVGTFLLIGSMVFSAVESFIESSKKQPDSPEVAFTKEILSPFVVKLPYPPQKWIDENILKKENKMLMANIIGAKI